MRATKLLCIASAVDLDHRYGCTPAWWQLWKGLHDEGVELIVTPYRGRPIETPWWRSAPNPAYLEGESYARALDVVAALKGDRRLRRNEDSPPDSLVDKATREAIWRIVTPRWRRHLERLVERERPDAVVVFTVPMAHFRGIPQTLRDRFDIPVVFYDGDVPMSLPQFGGMDAGFNYYHGADPGEYDLVISNSEGGLDGLLALGARRAETIFWGADPEFFAPQPIEKETDVFFYGHGDKFRREWMAALVGEPSRALPEVDFALGGGDFLGDIGNARLLGDVSFPAFPRAISAARINLCLTRRSHASVYASSSCRPFELAAAGAAIVANPYDGIERWFEPGSELLVVADVDEALAAYRDLLDDPAQAEEMGRRARERALDEHTYRHRARRLLDLLGLRAGSEARVD
jgi:glycosyltransferase involved in cell wall biosynthesis